MTSSAVFPKRLADCGFSLHNFGGVEAIVPPVCPIPEDGDRRVPTTRFIVGSDPKQDPEAIWWEHQGDRVNEPGASMSYPNLRAWKERRD